MAPICVGSWVSPLPLLGHEHGQVGLVAGEPLPGGLELPRAVGPVGPATLGLVRAHGDDGVDRPLPVILRAGCMLDADRPYLGLIAIPLQDDAVDFGSLLTWSDFRR